MTRIRLFPGIIFGLIGLNVCVVAITVYLAASDPSFAVEPDYDRRAMGWNETARQNQRNTELGWTASLTAHPADKRIEVRLADASGMPITDASLVGYGFRSLRASRRFDLLFTETAPGLYHAPILLNEPGRWEFRLEAARDADVFTASTGCELVALPHPSGAP